MNAQSDNEKTPASTRKNFYDSSYWRTEGRWLLELRRAMSFISAISVDGMPSSFVSTLDPESTPRDGGWYFSWGENGTNQLTIEVEPGSFCVYAMNKEFGFDFWYDFICPNEDPPKDRDVQAVDVTAELLDEAIAKAKAWMEQHKDELKEREGIDLNRRGLLLEFGLYS